MSKQHITYLGQEVLHGAPTSPRSIYDLGHFMSFTVVSPMLTSPM